MKWIDEGVVINLKRYGERSFIATILTKEHGKHLGIIKNKKINIGSRVNCRWNARISSQLGTFICEEIESFAHCLIMNKDFLYLFNSAKELIEQLIPDRESQPDLYNRFFSLVCVGSLQSYLSFELELLRLLGLSVDYNRCYSCKEESFYVSPSSGAGACFDHAIGYEHKLLKAPKSLMDMLNINSFFLEKYIYPSSNIQKISSRDILNDYLKSGNYLDKECYKIS